MVTNEDLIWLKDHYPNLKHKVVNEQEIILGSIFVNKIYNDFHVSESFDIEIEIPEDYPHCVPPVKETGGKVDTNYSHKYTSNYLCIGTTGEIMVKCDGVISLKFLIESYIIPYFFTYRYYKRFNQYPFGEREHGSIGIINSYIELFQIDSPREALIFLKNSLLKPYRGHLPCFCNSGKKIRQCHGELIRKIHENEPIKNVLLKELAYIEEEIKEYEQHFNRAE